MNTSLSEDLLRWSGQETDELKQNRLRFAAQRASKLEQDLEQATRIVPFPTSTRETLRLHLVRSLEMLGPKDAE